MSRPPHTDKEWGREHRSAIAKRQPADGGIQRERRAREWVGGVGELLPALPVPAPGHVERSQLRLRRVAAAFGDQRLRDRIECHRAGRMRWERLRRESSGSSASRSRPTSGPAGRAADGDEHHLAERIVPRHRRPSPGVGPLAPGSSSRQVTPFHAHVSLSDVPPVKGLCCPPKSSTCLRERVKCRRRIDATGRTRRPALRATSGRRSRSRCCCRFRSPRRAPPGRPRGKSATVKPVPEMGPRGNGVGRGVGVGRGGGAGRGGRCAVETAKPATAAAAMTATRSVDGSHPDAQPARDRPRGAHASIVPVFTCTIAT